MISTLDRLTHDGVTTIELPLTPLNTQAHLRKPQRNTLTGGNLALAQLSIGTPWQIETAGKTLFFEDVNEAPYRISEKLDHLEHAGIFKGVKAVIFGQFTRDAPDEKDQHLLQYIFSDFAKNMDFAVFSDLAVGHTANNHPLQLNAPVTLTPKEDSIFLQQTLTL